MSTFCLVARDIALNKEVSSNIIMLSGGELTV